MNFTQRTRGIVRAIAIVLVAGAAHGDGRSRRPTPASAAASARVPAARGPIPRHQSTSTAPGTAQPFNRTFSQPGSPTMGSPAAAGGGFFSRGGMGRGLLGGLAAGFLGAGLFGMLFGGGLFSGLGGLSSILGLLLQIGLIVLVVRLAMSWWQRRNTPAAAYAGGPAAGPGAQPSFRSGMGFGLGSGSAPLEIQPADYEAFERLLGEIQAAWSNEDVAKLHTLATPEMVSYFSQGSGGEQGPQRHQQGVRHQAAAGRPRGSLARRRNRLCLRGDAVLDGRQDAGSRPAGAWSPAASSPSR